MVDLPGWRPVADEPGIAELAPDLSGLDVVRRSDSPALVRNGDAIRATTFTFVDRRRRCGGSRARSSHVPRRSRSRASTVGSSASGLRAGNRVTGSRDAAGGERPGHDRAVSAPARGGRSCSSSSCRRADSSLPCGTRSSPRSVAEQRADQLVERLAVAARDDGGRHGPHRCRPGTFIASETSPK